MEEKKEKKGLAAFFDRFRRRKAERIYEEGLADAKRKGTEEAYRFGQELKKNYEEKRGQTKSDGNTEGGSSDRAGSVQDVRRRNHSDREGAG